MFWEFSSISLFLLLFCLYICRVISLVHRELLGKIRKKLGKVEKSGNFGQRNNESPEDALLKIDLYSNVTTKLTVSRKEQIGHSKKCPVWNIFILNNYTQHPSINFSSAYTTISFIYH